MAFVAFPEPAELKVRYEDMITDSKPKDFSQWSVENPHPGFGKDPNILNELGHTVYPKWIDSKITNGRIIVENAEEEAKHTSDPVASVPASPAPAADPAANPWPTAK